jgi:inositol transporter-like SP family MFS transporter
MFGVVRIALGGWLLMLPWVEDWGFQTLSVILFAMLLISGLVGIVFAPDTTGRDLRETGEDPDAGRARFRRAAAEEEPVTSSP